MSQAAGQNYHPNSEVPVRDFFHDFFKKQKYSGFEAHTGLSFLGFFLSRPFGSLTSSTTWAGVGLGFGFGLLQNLGILSLHLRILTASGVHLVFSLSGARTYYIPFTVCPPTRNRHDVRIDPMYRDFQIDITTWTRGGIYLLPRMSL